MASKSALIAHWDKVLSRQPCRVHHCVMFDSRSLRLVASVARQERLQSRSQLSGVRSVSPDPIYFDIPLTSSSFRATCTKFLSGHTFITGRGRPLHRRRAGSRLDHCHYSDGVRPSLLTQSSRKSIQTSKPEARNNQFTRSGMPEQCPQTQHL